MRTSTSKRNVAAKRTATTKPSAKKRPAKAPSPASDDLVFPPATPAEISQELLWESLARLEAQADALQCEITTLRRLIGLAETCRQEKLLAGAE